MGQFCLLRLASFFLFLVDASEMVSDFSNGVSSHMLEEELGRTCILMIIVLDTTFALRNVLGFSEWVRWWDLSEGCLCARMLRVGSTLRISLFSSMFKFMLFPSFGIDSAAGG